MVTAYRQSFSKPPPRRSLESTPKALRGSLLRQAVGVGLLKQTPQTSFAPAILPGNITLRPSRKFLPWKQMFPQQHLRL